MHSPAGARAVAAQHYCPPPSLGAAGFASFAGRSRLINLMLTTISTAAAVSTWYEGEAGCDMCAAAGTST